MSNTITKYKANHIYNTITSEEISSETPTLVKFKKGHRIRAERKNSELLSWHDSHEEAYKNLQDRLEEKKQRYLKQVERCEEESLKLQIRYGTINTKAKSKKNK